MSYENPTSDKTKGSRNRREEALSMLAGARGPQFTFLQTALNALALGLDCEIAAVGEISADKRKFQPLAILNGGAFIDPVAFDIAGTPCEELYTSPEDVSHICYSEGLCDLFPLDQILQASGAQGYRAEPVRDVDGDIFGHVYVIDNKPMAIDDESTMFFRLVSQRIGAEINRWRAESARETSEIRQQDLLNNTSSVIYIKDADGRYVFVNQTFEKLFHISNKEVKGKTDHDLFPKEKADILRANDLKALESEEPQEIEEIVPHDDGLHAYISVKFPLKDKSGQAYAVCGISTDITERKQAEDELRSSENSLRETKRLLEGAIQSFSDGFALFDADDRFVFANEFYLTAHKEVRDIQVPGTPFEAIVNKLAEIGFYGNSPDEIEECIRVRLERFRNGETFEYEMADGRWYQVNQYEASGGGKSIVRTNITKIKEAETLRLEAESRFRAIIDNSPAPIFFKDLEGRFLIANAKHEEGFDAKASELIGKTSQPFVGEDAYQAIVQQDQEVMRTRKVVTKVHAFSGREFLTIKFPVFNAQGELLGLGGIDTDISELRQAEKALAQSEARFRDFAEASSDWFWEMDQKGRITWQSEIHGTSVWLARKTVIGKTRQEVAGQYLSDTDWQPYQNAISGELEFRNFEYCYEGTDNSLLHARISGNPIYDEDGNFLGHRGVASNITELREAEELLRKAQKMEAVGQLTGGIAHDFNNLMAVMIGNAEMLVDIVEHDENAKQNVEAIIRSIERGSSLTSRLLAFSRQQSLSPIAVDVTQLIVDLEDMLRRTLGEATDLQVESVANLWHALIDPHQLESALLNLAINARDAMPGGGTLVIETSNVTFDTDYAKAHEEVQPGEYVVIAVSDTGSGMAPDVLEKVFEPFFTTKDVGKGSGLGLSMVYGLAKQSNGHLTIYSEVGQGTTVRLYLPRGPVLRAANDDAVEDARPAPGSERILVVEDDPGVRAVSVNMLSSHGYEIVEAEDGKEAIALLEGNPKFDLLFTDIVLPGGMNGMDIVDAAQKIQPGIKVLYTTGYAERAVVHNDELDLNAEVVNKPYRRSELLEKVRAILDDEGSD
ncbi:MAG: PAS domain-containing protein [Alphaproteobacteria bacterium]|jgi:PAS domain S-box-containing protein|nr:PAS domain-containing protein [Alphaproteobacteria bacterium]MBT4016396.1 PAS domain-containing protein [Alphaproteobacteria bacterium]MBT4965040.1 PAS domain-containing protein [Alphaproteobacteria bacterium]MBT5159576.1 PAS domain-containing protein [Alphaproteobacteria bacterium]MBT7745395.1 PAS domain-containing protein [Alphaproteobacteria bacterium]